MAGRSGKCESRPPPGRSPPPTGSSVLPTCAGSADLYRWLECVSTKHSMGLSRQSEKDGWQRTLLFSSLARALYCHHYQTYEEETGGGGETKANLGGAWEGAEFVFND